MIKRIHFSRHFSINFRVTLGLLGLYLAIVGLRQGHKNSFPKHYYLVFLRLTNFTVILGFLGMCRAILGLGWGQQTGFFWVYSFILSTFVF